MFPSKVQRCKPILLTVFFLLAFSQTWARITDRNYTAWQLRPPTSAASDLRDGSYRVDEIQAGATGGYVRITYLGTEGCRGQVQRFKFTWRFDRDISAFYGGKGTQAFSVDLSVEGDDNRCMNVNPYWSVSSNGDLLSRNMGGEARFYARPHNFHVPGTRLFSVNQTNRTEEGIRIGIWLPCPGGCWVNVDYTYDGSDDASGGGTGGAGNKARCEQYAREAVDQNQANVIRGCGFTGDRWHGNYEAHFNWCMNVDRSWADSETRGRQEQLQGCKGQWPGLGRGRTLGGLDLDAFCKSKGAAGCRLDGQTWKCYWPDGSERVINLDNACRKQYGEPGAIAIQGKPGDPQTWTCVVPGK